MSNLTPTHIIDKNGKATTVHKNLDKGNGASNRASGIAAPAPAATTRAEIEPYEFSDETTELFDHDYFDVRDMAKVFTDIGSELESYLESARTAHPELEDDESVTFDEESESESGNLIELLDKHHDIIENIGLLPPPDKPEEYTPENLRQYAEDIAAAWEAVGDNHGVIVIQESYVAGNAEEYAFQTGSFNESTMPSWLTNNIDWQAAGESLVEDNPYFNIDDTKYYVT
jgi:hypothetical protein